MSTLTLPRHRTEVVGKALAKALTEGFFKKVAGITKGGLQISYNGTDRFFGSRSDALQAVVKIHDERFFPLVAFEGSVGAGEAYILGYWECAQLTDLIRLFVLNRDVLENVDGGLVGLVMPFLRGWHYFKRNTVTGSEKNIHAHYDLGNDFFEKVLDETMTYSCGILESIEGVPDADAMKKASIEKIDRLCRKLDLKKTDHLLEIGTGWGALAIHAASVYGCKVTTTTISRQQFEYATKKVKEAGLQSQIEIVMKDYRLLEGSFDKAVSVEMIEAVGHQFYPQYFGAISKLLKDDGLFALQAITIRDQIFDEAVRAVDFIQRFVFPGSNIPSVNVMQKNVAEHTDMRFLNLEDITASYPPTLRFWKKNLQKNEEELVRSGYPKELIRLWDFYLSYCEGGFLERNIGDVQIIMAKPAYRGGN